jgi:hypothetical protein
MGINLWPLIPELLILPKELVILSEAKDLLSVEPWLTEVFPGRIS